MIGHMLRRSEPSHEEIANAVGRIASAMQTKLFVLFIGMALARFIWPPISSAQVDVIPGSSVRGADLFQKKACVQCHAFGGVGGKVGPDLAQPNGRAHTPMQLASALWNHGPQMW